MREPLLANSNPSEFTLEPRESTFCQEAWSIHFGRRHGAQKLSEAVFCRPLNQQASGANRMQKIASLNFCAPKVSIY
ncbi:hypothetical protein QUF75_10320 [Desulfococcaceae bacterium HSG7]|nr:hypothetical protein [Desulfococcaceae bacterium HSG7]